MEVKNKEELFNVLGDWDAVLDCLWDEGETKDKEIAELKAENEQYKQIAADIPIERLKEICAKERAEKHLTAQSGKGE